jgi:hypothetical protein
LTTGIVGGGIVGLQLGEGEANAASLGAGDRELDPEVSDPPQAASVRTAAKTLSVSRHAVVLREARFP